MKLTLNYNPRNRFEKSLNLQSISSHSLFLALSLFIFTTTYTQVFDKNEKSLYKTKKNQHTITYSPTVYFGYNYAYQFNPNLTDGAMLRTALV